MKSKTNIYTDEQMSLFDILASSKGLLDEMSTSDFEAVLDRLREEKYLSRKREEERQRKEKEERKRKEKEDHIKEVTSMELPLDWNNIFDTDIRAQEVHFESIPDALIHCLSTLGRVDIEFISSITGVEYKTVICALKGSIYQNPDIWDECFYKGWETSEEYLSGNLKRKWNTAKKANEEYKGYFEENINAIEKVLPSTVATKEIYITLGSPWVPADIIDDFIVHLFGDPLRNTYSYDNFDKENLTENWKTIHDEVTGTWEIPCKSRYHHSIGVSRTYGTERIEALHILEKTLNMKTVSVTEEIACLTNVSGKKRVINKAETVMALEKQQKLIDEFKKWVWEDEIRKKRLESIFENNFSCVRRRIFDGSFLQFPTMSSSVHLYPYQKDAVARIIFTPNTLLAHDVGSGKTYVMIAAGQELRRMGMSKKNLYVVPNNIVGEWERIFLTMYPNAKLLIVESKNFVPSKRENVLLDIKNNDYDGIIMTYSCFEQIPLSKSYYTDELETKKEMISNLVLQKSKATSKLKKKKEALEKALSELAVEMDNVYDTVYFDELGITRLFVDEAHNFKNVPIETNAKMVSGISSSGSKKCKDMMDKVHMIQKQNDGKGVVFATGTPITNSITDAYIMQQYLQRGELALLELQSFDSWIGMFAEKVTEFEIDVDINSYRLVTRFSRFHNLPELTSLLCSIADFHQINENAGIPKMDGYSDVLVSKTMEFADYLNSISQRVDDIRHGCVNRRDDNMLKITTDGRRAALDLRLVDPTSSFTYQSKVARCAENVADIYFKTSRNKSTQLIFCDTSVPKPGFNIYDELKDRLIMLGVPECQVAFIHSANTEGKRASLFAKVRKGTVRILIGSTFKLGLGVNIQNKLIALHHMDVPWRPSDMTQREGRIIRHGNENPNVKIFRYITEGSFDAYSWQLLETKQRFITGLLSGTMTERSGADIDNTVLDYAEVKALAIGNPLIKERVEVANELTRYMILQRKFIESRMCLEKELLELPGKIEYQENTIQKCMEDVLFYSEWKQQYAPINNTGLKKDVSSRRKILREQISQAVKENVLRTVESYLMDYCGFDVILPANMTLEKPYVWLERNGRYYVELGDSEVGNLIRIEKFLDNLSCYLEKLKIGLCRLQEKESEIKADLAKSESYLNEIAKYKKRLEVIDKKLGVIKK